ncbi:MAG: hypothetical protein HC875_31775 [Anaerolineales bacterium]|nr:hypothetical protein [Anaerolineales bacterium]
MVVAYPDNIQVEESLRQVIFNQYDLDPSHFQFDRPQNLLWQFCQEYQIEFYDLWSAFQAKQQEGQRPYLINDSHWNEIGNQVAAQYLFATLLPKAQTFLADQSTQ